MNNTLEEALALTTGPLSRLALRYSFIMRDLVIKSKEPGFTDAGWAPLAELVATDEFERIGCFREKLSWDQYDGLLTMWGKATIWDFTVLNTTEGDGYAIVELEEYATYPDRTETYNSLTIHEFNAASKLSRLKLYLSQAQPASAVPSPRWDLTETAAATV